MTSRTGMVAALLATAFVAAVPSAQAGIATDEMMACAALGPKHPGTDADRRMGDRLVERFRAAGLETSVEEFHMPVWKPGPTTARIVGSHPAAGLGWKTEPFAYSGTGKVTAEVVDLGNGAPADYEGKDVKGKVVLVDRSESYHRTVQVEQVIAHGGAAMLLKSASPNNLIQTGSVRWAQRPPAPIPAATLGDFDGDALRAEMAKGPVTLELDVRGERVDAVGRNVIGLRRGTTYPDRYVIVAGHYDSWYAGAFDNCTAVGSLLHTVDALKSSAPAMSVLYIGWDAEEPGLVGSYDWIWRHQDLMKKAVLNVNLEETASAIFLNGQKLDGLSVSLAASTSSPTLLSSIVASAATNALTPVLAPMGPFRSLSGGIIPTDIEGFYGQGVQGFTTAALSPYYHTTEDTADKIDGATLERVSQFVATAVDVTSKLSPELLAMREVPTVALDVPAAADAGAAVPVEATVTDPDGSPVTGARLLMLATQRDAWAVGEGIAEEVGGGKYRWTVPAGATDAGMTRVRATLSDARTFANGFATVDQRRGGLLPSGRACRSRRVLTLHVGRRGVRSLRVVTSRGKARVRRGARSYVIRLDLRGVRTGEVRVRLTARRASGRVVRQTRTFRTCG